MERQYVGIDLHRRRSVIVRMDGGGEVLSVRRIDNDPMALAAEIAEAGPEPEVVVEATYGWYWAVEVMRDSGARVHLAHPLGVKAFAYQRVKKDDTDARLLADLLWMGRLPEAWIAPPVLRELRELIRYRTKLVNTRPNLKFQAYGVLAKEGVRVPMSDLFGKEGLRLLDEAGLAPSYRLRVASRGGWWPTWTSRWPRWTRSSHGCCGPTLAIGSSRPFPGWVPGWRSPVRLRSVRGLG